MDWSLPLCEWRTECGRWAVGLVFAKGLGEVPTCERCAAEARAHLTRVPSWVLRTYSADLAQRRAEQARPERLAA